MFEYKKDSDVISFKGKDYEVIRDPNSWSSTPYLKHFSVGASKFFTLESVTFGDVSMLEEQVALANTMMEYAGEHARNARVLMNWSGCYLYVGDLWFEIKKGNRGELRVHGAGVSCRDLSTTRNLDDRFAEKVEISIRNTPNLSDIEATIIQYEILKRGRR